MQGEDTKTEVQNAQPIGIVRWQPVGFVRWLPCAPANPMLAGME